MMGIKYPREAMMISGISRALAHFVSIFLLSRLKTELGITGLTLMYYRIFARNTQSVRM